MTTHHVTWHPDRVLGAVERCNAEVLAKDPEQPCELAWLDLACLLDIARAWLAAQQPCGDVLVPDVTCDQPPGHDGPHGFSSGTAKTTWELTP